MNFSKPSVNRAVRLLKEGEFITVDKDGYITLTDAGREIAEKIYERHTLLTNFLTGLGVDEETAADDACKMEHDISDTVFEAIKKRLFNFFSGTDHPLTLWVFCTFYCTKHKKRNNSH